MAARDWNKLAEEILEKVGGPENISGMTHCATRLRLNLRDESIVDDAEVKAIDGVTNIARAAGQYQLLIGIEVPKLYEKFEALVKGSGKAELTKADTGDQSLVNKVFATISGIFSPILAPLAGSGVLRGLIILFTQMGLLTEGSSTYTILFSAASAVFYLLPVLLLISTAKRFEANTYIAALIGGALIYPDFVALMGDAGNGAMADFFGIPVVLMGYSSTVVPAILAGLAYSWLYKKLDDTVPENLKLVIPPLVSLVVMVPLTVIVIGPLAVYGGELVANVVNWAINASGLLTGILVGGGWAVLVSFGIHWAVNPIMINNIAEVGFDYICPLTFACNFAVIGVALGVFFKAKNQEVKSFSLTGVITIVLSAIIEPTLFGLLVNNKKLFAAQIIAGAVGGAYLGLMRVVTSAFVFGSVVTFPAFVNGDMMNFVNAMIGLGISTVIGAVLGYMFCEQDMELA
jgi:PTS system beta-glucosides-specific IIC component